MHIFLPFQYDCFQYQTLLPLRDQYNTADLVLVEQWRIRNPRDPRKNTQICFYLNGIFSIRIPAKRNLYQLIPKLGWCWSSVYDAGPASTQLWLNVSQKYGVPCRDLTGSSCVHGIDLARLEILFIKISIDAVKWLSTPGNPNWWQRGQGTA